LVSAVGLVPVMALADRAGLSDLVGEHVSLAKPGGANAAVKVSALVAGMVAGADSVDDMGLLRHGGRAVIGGAAPQPGQRRRLAWALTDRPELLTGAGAQAPVRAVLRLIDALADAGANGIIRPPCPHCGRVIALVKPRGGVRLCRNCVAKSRAETCSRCGVHREAATRDEQGRALCPQCLITDPANQEICLLCRRRRPVSVRTPAGPLCPSCRPIATVTCSICGRSAPGSISQLTGQACCHACLQRLRQRQTGSQRNPHPTTLRFLHSPWRPLARLSRLRRAHPAPLAPMRPLHAPTTTG